MSCPGENIIAAFVGGELAAPGRTELHAHLEGCAECRHLVAALVRSARDEESRLSVADTRPSAASADGTPPPRLGRYILLETIGTGGMGRVFSAYDPVLERRVALKVVRGGRAPEVAEAVRARLLREGRSIAQLNHPNIVAVFDMGTSEGEVYVAMELVAGGSLRQWLAAAPRSWREVLRAYLEAGRGLAAAHRTGLVHRDFKPENVLVGDDGRVRVSDFGLSVSHSSGAGAPSGQPVATDARLTETGALVGTPAYMSPEQFRGEPADALSDQFSFCLALWTDLYGARPFASAERGGTVSWQRVEPPATSGVPPAVRRALERGLELQPSRRFPTMDALLQALSSHLAMRSRRWLLAGAALALGALTGGLLLAQRWVRPCTDSLAQAELTWNPVVAASLRQVLAGAGAGVSAALVERRLSEYVGGWVAMRTAACEATRVHGAQSDQVLTVRMACLDRRRAELAALVTLLGAADGDTAARAPEAVEALTPLAVCADVEALLSQAPPPERAEVQVRVDAVRQALAASKALADVGRYEEARAGAAKAVEDARGAGYAPALAEALAQLGRTQEQLGALKPAEETLLDAVSTAEAARHDAVRAEAATALMLVVGVRQARYAEAHAWDKLAAGAIARVGSSPLLEARLLQTRGLVSYAEGKLQEAIDAHRRAVALLEQAAPASVALGVALNELGAALRGARRAPEALATFQRALEVLEPRVGADSDLVAQTKNGLASTLMLDGHFEKALPLYRAALSVFERRLGPRHYRTVTAVNNVGVVLAEERRFAEALPYFERVVAAREATAADAKAADAHANLGMLLLELGRLGDAQAQLERASGLLQGLPLDHFSQAEPLLGTARLALARGHGKEAEAPLARVLALCAGKQGFRFDYTRARAQFLMARVLLEAKQEAAQGRALAETARAALVGFGEQRFRRDIAEVTAWLEAHPAGRR